MITFKGFFHLSAKYKHLFALCSNPASPGQKHIYFIALDIKQLDIMDGFAFSTRDPYCMICRGWEIPYTPLLVLISSTLTTNDECTITARPPLW